MAICWHSRDVLSLPKDIVPGSVVTPLDRKIPEGLIVGVSDSCSQICVLWPGEDPTNDLWGMMSKKIINEIQEQEDAAILAILQSVK